MPMPEKYAALAKYMGSDFRRMKIESDKRLINIFVMDIIVCGWFFGKSLAYLSNKIFCLFPTIKEQNDLLLIIFFTRGLL